MKTIALRYSDNFAPDVGTITAHQELLSAVGYVWYGKLGSPISFSVQDDILRNEKPKILLIHSGERDRYWAYIDKIQREAPPLDKIPSYYRYMNEKFHTWFRVIKFETATMDILSRCFVASSGATLSNASRHSMSPYFIIKYDE